MQTQTDGSATREVVMTWRATEAERRAIERAAAAMETTFSEITRAGLTLFFNQLSNEGIQMEGIE